jgi:MraZ protein
VSAPLFYNNIDLKIDAKNRLFIPSEVRRRIDTQVHGTGLFVTLGHNQLPWLYPEKYYESLVPPMPAEMTPDNDWLNYVRLKFALADRIEPDEQGRVVLPEKILAAAGIDKDITLAGCIDHLEIWNRSAWIAYVKQLVANSEQIETKGKEAILKASKSREGISTAGIAR